MKSLKALPQYSDMNRGGVYSPPHRDFGQTLGLAPLIAHNGYLTAGEWSICTLTTMDKTLHTEDQGLSLACDSKRLSQWHAQDDQRRNHLRYFDLRFSGSMLSKVKR